MKARNIYVRLPHIWATVVTGLRLFAEIDHASSRSDLEEASKQAHGERTFIIHFTLLSNYCRHSFISSYARSLHSFQAITSYSDVQRRLDSRIHWPRSVDMGRGREGPSREYKGAWCGMPLKHVSLVTVGVRNGLRTMRIINRGLTAYPAEHRPDPGKSC